MIKSTVLETRNGILSPTDRDGWCSRQAQVQPQWPKN